MTLASYIYERQCFGRLALAPRCRYSGYSYRITISLCPKENCMVLWCCYHIYRLHVLAYIVIFLLASTGIRAAGSSSITCQLAELFACSNLRLDGSPWLQLPESPGTTINIPFWEQELVSHMDKQFVEYILRGLQAGFRIGFQASTCKLHLTLDNLVSAATHPQVVSSYTAGEVELQQVACIGLTVSMASRFRGHPKEWSF